MGAKIRVYGIGEFLIPRDAPVSTSRRRELGFGLHPQLKPLSTATEFASFSTYGVKAPKGFADERIATQQ
jgi:hypothetical protein